MATVETSIFGFMLFKCSGKNMKWNKQDSQITLIHCCTLTFHQYFCVLGSYTFSSARPVILISIYYIQRVCLVTVDSRGQYQQQHRINSLAFRNKGCTILHRQLGLVQQDFYQVEMAIKEWDRRPISFIHILPLICGWLEPVFTETSFPNEWVTILSISMATVESYKPCLLKELFLQIGLKWMRCHLLTATVTLVVSFTWKVVRIQMLSQHRRDKMIRHPLLTAQPYITKSKVMACTVWAELPSLDP